MQNAVSRPRQDLGSLGNFRAKTKFSQFVSWPGDIHGFNQAKCVIFWSRNSECSVFIINDQPRNIATILFISNFMELLCKRFCTFSLRFNTFSIVILQPGFFLLISFASAKPSPELPPVMTTCFGSIALGSFTLRKRKITNKTAIVKIIEEVRVIGMKNSIL